MVVGFALLALLAVGCASSSQRLRSEAERHDWSLHFVDGQGFVHALVGSDGARRQASSSGAADVLHVYIDGDGSPWRNGGTRVARDPSPRDLLVLALMAQDPQAAIYVGRPCYFPAAPSAACQPSVWTRGRYSAAVLDSMAAVIDAQLNRHSATEVVLIGYSGGGALAALLAARVPRVSALVTVAGNLDTRAWVAHHGYRPLVDSLNPMQAATIAPDVVQWHLVGARDEVVPASIVHDFAATHGGEVWEVEGFDHRCCWRALWPEVLEGLGERLASNR